MTDTAASDRAKLEPREDSSSRVFKVVNIDDDCSGPPPSPAYGYHIRKHY